MLRGILIGLLGAVLVALCGAVGWLGVRAFAWAWARYEGWAVVLTVALLSAWIVACAIINSELLPPRGRRR